MSSNLDLRLVYRIAAWATVTMLILIPVQIGVFVAFPPPTTVEGWFTLFQTNPVVGFIDSDLLLTVNNGLLLAIGVGFWFSLKDENPGLVALALVLGAVGIASYLSSTMSFEMARLAALWAADTGNKAALLAAGQGLVLRWQGTAFDAYYVLNGLALVLVAAVMLRSPTFGRHSALVGLAAGVLMVVPSTAGTLGLVCSLLSLVPWYWFALRFAKVFFRLAQALTLSRHPLSDPR